MSVTVWWWQREGDPNADNKRGNSTGGLLKKKETKDATEPENYKL